MRKPLRIRKSPRLRGYDYREEGSYFVTICVRHRVPLFGAIARGALLPSPAGTLAERIWQSIPHHHPRVSLGLHQIMPDHIHGILTLCPIHAAGSPTRASSVRGTADVAESSLSTIIGCYKAAVTKAAREAGLWGKSALWQPRFHDHIIRGDFDHFWIELYIEANPILWEFDQSNPKGKSITYNHLAEVLEQALDLHGEQLTLLMRSRMLERIRMND